MTYEFMRPKTIGINVYKIRRHIELILLFYSPLHYFMISSSIEISSFSTYVAIISYQNMNILDTRIAMLVTTIT